MHIVYVSDGKAGHRSQALGLFQAMQRQQPETTFEEILISDLPIISLIQALFSTKSLLKKYPILYLEWEATHIFVSGYSAKFLEKPKLLY